MRHLHKRLAKLYLAKDASFSKCMGDNCSNAPEREAIWAEGRGRAWHCQKCHDKWVKDDEAEAKLGKDDYLPLAIVKERKVPNGVVGDKYGVYPETKKAAMDPKVEFIVKTNAIEGYRIDPKEVQDALDAVAEGYPVSFATQNKHILAQLKMLEKVGSITPNSKGIQQLHRLQGGDVLDSGAAGMWRSGGAKSSGGMKYVDGDQIPAAMQWWDRARFSPFQKVAVLMQIHPFEDGNGRMGRMALLKLNGMNFSKTNSQIGGGYLSKLRSAVKSSGLDMDDPPWVKTAKDSRTGPGYNVGLFLPLPRQLSKKFPALGTIDNTPSHITFLRIGSVKDPADQVRLMKVLREIFQRRWSQCKASLGGIEVFTEPDHKVVSVSVVFNKDMFALRQRIKKDLEKEGFTLPNRHPEFKPHVTLKRIPLGEDYQGRIPRGTWGFNEMEIWGLPKVHKIKFGGNCKMGTPEINAAAVRAVMAKLAKAEGKKEWGGTSVGLFIPLPKRLAKKFPSLGEQDTSPSHVTFLYIGDVKGEKEQKHLIDTLKKVHGKWWPEVTAKLDGLAHFDHKDKDRRVAHVQVDFDKDLSGMRHRVKQELEDGGITVGDSFPEYKPHVTLEYMSGIDSPDYAGDIPEGTWNFKGMEVWGLPKTHKIKFGPSFYKVSQMWLEKQARSPK